MQSDQKVSRPSGSGALRNPRSSRIAMVGAGAFLGPQVRALFGTRVDMAQYVKDLEFLPLESA